MNILFLCSSNINRSKTAETFFRELYPQHTFASAGLNEKSCRDNNTTFATESMLEKADRIFVMEDKHLWWIVNATGNRFALKLVNLEIPDVYRYMDESLLDVLRIKMKDHLHTDQ
jgi:predicted protein tyrosine phosphatase